MAFRSGSRGSSAAVVVPGECPDRTVGWKADRKRAEGWLEGWLEGGLEGGLERGPEGELGGGPKKDRVIA